MAPAMDQIAAPGRAFDVFSRYGTAALRGLGTGDYTVAEKGPLEATGEAIGDVLTSPPDKLPPQASYPPVPPSAAVRTEPQYATPPAGKYSWEEYNARRRRAEEMGLPQAQLSPQGVGIANANLARYEAGQRAERGEPPVREITSSDGKRLTLSPENFDLITRFLAFLDTQPAPNLEPRMEVGREATRRLTEDRMRREELARQFRTLRR
jgi:hypothetical protein